MKHLLLSLVALLASTALEAYDFQADHLSYTITNDTLSPYTVEVASNWQLHYGDTIIVPESVVNNDITYIVTGIGQGAFFDEDIVAITLPNSIRYIDDCAFTECYALKNINIPESLEYIGISAFADCISLEIPLALPNTLTRLGDAAFMSAGITHITIPESVTSIGSQALQGTSLETVVIPNSVTYMGDGVFQECYVLTSVTLPAELTTLGNNFFYDCRKLRTINLPDSLQTIGELAFGYCSSIGNIAIPEKMQSIAYNAFEGCYFAESRFENYSNLTPSDNNYWGAAIADEEVDGMLIASKVLIYARDTIQSAIIPSHVKAISSSVFVNNDVLTHIYIPKGVLVIDPWALVSCRALRSIVVEEGNWIYDSRDNCNAIIEKVTNTLLLGCQGTIIPDGVKHIGSGAFSDTESPDSIVLPSSVTSIGESAFSNCDSLQSIVLNEGLKSIGEYAFTYCDNLSTVVCKAVAVPTMGEQVFDYDLENDTLYVPNESLELYKNAEQWQDFGTILPIGSVPTEVDNLYLNSTPRKVFYNNQIQIWSEDKKYTVTGTEVR